jgi:hypothetical protein
MVTPTKRMDRCITTCFTCRTKGVEAANALRPFAEIGFVNFELFTIRTERTARDITQAIEPVLGPTPQYILASVDNVGYQGKTELAVAASFLRPSRPGQ